MYHRKVALIITAWELNSHMLTGHNSRGKKQIVKEKKIDIRGQTEQHNIYLCPLILWKPLNSFPHAIYADNYVYYISNNSAQQ